MMKRALSLLLVVMMTLSLAAELVGCGSDKAENDKKEEKKDTTSESQSADTGALTAEDLVFSYNGVTVELNGDADAAVAQLGEAKDVSSQLSCHGEGDDKTYTYDGFVLNTYPLDGKDRVLEIVVNAPGIATSKGIEVGAAVADVTAAYGSDYKQVGMYYAYEGGDGKSLQFFVQDDKVQEISYYYDV